MSSNVCVYSFADASGVTSYVDDVGDYYYNGTWSSSGTYLATPLNAVSYGAAMYMCIRDNIGDNPQRVPTRTRPTSWSIMSLLYEYQCTGTLDGVAADAYRLAESGTNIAWAAYNLAQIGTNTGSAAYDLAGSAFALAGSASVDVAEAMGVASSAFTIAVAGTNAAAVAQSRADAAYALAQIGTNTGTAALSAAAAAQSTANGAFAVAVAGTNAAATAQSTADAAWALAQMGTNTGTYAIGLANDALGVLSTRWSGTVSVWAAGTEGGTANIELIFINGILNTYAPA